MSDSLGNTTNPGQDDAGPAAPHSTAVRPLVECTDPGFTVAMVDRFRRQPLAAALLAAALLICAKALWIPAKAVAAQVLLQRSWQAEPALPAPPPWPWADMRPVLELSAPDHGIRHLVVDNPSARHLAFAPVATWAGADPLLSDTIIQGHRDTHFDFLQKLSLGDEIRIADRHASRRFRVSQIDIVDSRRRALTVQPGLARISLVSCYPFDTPTAGGPWRYVVTALPVSDAVTNHPAVRI